ncbi:MAG TPA: carbohydrate binding domain-containing protein, partial [Polyangiaceae bacterium]|nr:carbohydrate binding domain-containing protein [Polyangiaceae bacterium]
TARTPEDSTMTTNDDERRAFDRLLDAARKEAPPAELGERLQEQLAYRARLERLVGSPPAARGYRAAALALALLAAGVLILLFALKPRADVAITAEQAASASKPAGSAAAPPAPAPPADDPCRSIVPAAGSEPLIDDFEDGDDAIRPFEGRAGFWRWAREIDAPGTAPALIPVPRPEATRTNRLAQHVKGGLLVDWGATVEFNFRPACYDASNYVGVSFQARGPGRIYFAPRERAVIPVAEGGSCQSDCYNPHVAKIDLDGSWRTYQLRFSDLRQRGMGKPALDPQHLHSLAFMIRPEDTPYDVWLDELRFLQH